MRRPIDPPRHRRDGEWPEAGQSAPESQTGQIRPATVRKTPRRWQAGGDPDQGTVRPHHTTQSGSCPAAGRVGRAPAVGCQRHFPGRTTAEEMKEALQTAREWRSRDAVWIDGSRLDSGKVGAACVWQTPSGWTGRRYHVGTNKEVFDVETYQAPRALAVPGERPHVTISVDSTTAINRVRTGEAGSGQRIAVATEEVGSWILSKKNEIAIHCVSSLQGIHGKGEG